MRLIAENTEIPLLPNASIQLVENSPYLEFKQVGDKSYDFGLPVTPRLRSLIQNKNHIQSVEAPRELEAKVYLGPQPIINGQLRFKKQKDSILQCDLIAPPGNIPSSFWKTNLRDLDLGTYMLPTEEIVDPIWTIKHNHVGLGQITAGEVLFGNFYLADQTILKVFWNDQEIFSHYFNLAGYGFDSRKSIAFAELQASVAQYNENPEVAESEIYVTKEEMAFIVPNITGDLKIEIRYLSNSRRSAIPADNFVFSNLPQLKHRSAKKYLESTTAIGAPEQEKQEYLRFVPIYAPKFYAENASSYNKTLNYRYGGVLQFNDFRDRVAYPLSLVFRWSYLFERIFSLVSYSKDDWDWLESLMIYPLIDFARQHEETELPYNIYPDIVSVSNYVPNWTVEEFVNNFQLLTGHIVTFDNDNKRLDLKNLRQTLESPAIPITKANLIEQDYTKVQTTAVKYSGLIESEYETEDVKAFIGIETENNFDNSLNLSVIPLPPLPEEYEQRRGYVRATALTRAPRSGSASDPVLSINDEDTADLFCHSVSKSILFTLEDNEPVPRVSFLNNNKAVTTAAYSLSRSAENSLHNHFVQLALNKKTGRFITIKTFLRQYDLRSLIFENIIQFKGRIYLLIERKSAIKLQSQVFEVEMKLELLND